MTTMRCGICDAIFPDEGDQPGENFLTDHIFDEHQDLFRTIFIREEPTANGEGRRHV